ncbi:LOW QUALITY PROTEIN: taste receptor type 2 member 103-like [Arvicola amphibius]|uniref:LOW QUALITY PROTEIN: taste receptor type 2 member 103-like n=1 Tax=Arvicola amphibius TaxID=1047088 RepID=UPI001C0A4B16|nr:LOW QUALITY PROTEIN: taste receptor type 2 member 103-like [Arvicola amphibius]
MTSKVTLITTVNMEFIIGSLGNAFIALVNILDWVKKRKISLVDQILTALAISRTAFLFSLVTTLLVALLDPAAMTVRRGLKMHIISWMVTHHFSVWFATFLSIFYFLKIANFSNSIFLTLKWKAKRVVLITLVVSLIILFINIIVINILTDGPKVNTPYRSSSNNTVDVYVLILLTNTMFTLIPYPVTLITLLLLIFSLCRHLKNMQCHDKRFRDVSAAAHIKSLQSVVTFLLLYTVFVMSLLFQTWNINFYKKNLMVLFFWSTTIAFPSGYSCVLILGNRELRQAFLSVLWWLRCTYKYTEN